MKSLITIVVACRLGIAFLSVLIAGTLAAKSLEGWGWFLIAAVFLAAINLTWFDRTMPKE